MTASNGYAVFFFPPALEALGDAIKPYLQDSPAGTHVLCNEIDTGGALLEMTIQGATRDGGSVMLDLMVPASMVRMIVSSQSDASFGFGPRVAEAGASVPLGGVADTNNDGGPVGAEDKARARKPGVKPGKGKAQAASKSSKTRPVKDKPAKRKPAKRKPAKGKPSRSKGKSGQQA